MYEIRVLEDKEFNLLPYPDVEDSFGLADEKRGVAFVRHTGVKELDDATIRHEFDELMMKVSPHEESGIRYKKGSSIIRAITSIASMIPGPHQPFAVAANVGFTGSDIAKRGFQPLDALSLAGPALGAVKGATAAGAGFGSKLAGGLKGAVGLSGASGLAPKLSGSDPSKLSGSLANIRGGSDISGLSTLGKSSSLSGGVTNAFNTATKTALPSFGRSTMSFLDPLSSGASGLSSNLSPNSQQAIDAAAGNFQQQPTLMDNLKQGGKNIAVGAAKNAAVNALSPQQQLLPQQNPVAGAGFNAGGGAGGTGGPTALRQFAPQLDFNTDVSLKLAEADFSPAITQTDFDRAIADIGISGDRRTRDVFDMFRRKQPGSGPEDNPRFASQLASVEQSTAKSRSDFETEANRINQEKYTNYQAGVETNRQTGLYGEIKTNNSLTDAQMKEFIGLAMNADDEELTRKFSNTPAEIRQMFGGLTQFA